MEKQLWKDTLGWGVMLWLIGYALGMVLFYIVPTDLIGWVITPIGVLVTVYVLVKKINHRAFSDFLLIGAGWTLLAITLDYLFIVKMLKPADGYYKADVYLYYILTFFLPLIIGRAKLARKGKSN